MNNRFRFDAPSVADEEELHIIYGRFPADKGSLLLNSAAAPIMKKMNWSAAYWHAVSSGTSFRLSLYGWRRITGDRALLPDC